MNSGHAYRLVISRGLRIEPSQLLTMDGASLRQMVQDALVCDIFARPPGPPFTLGRTSNFANAPYHPEGDRRPTWISELHHRFNQSFTVESPDYEPFVIIAAWYVNGDSSHACMTPHEVRLTNSPTDWRTDIVFSWRTNLIRAVPADFVTVQGLPTHPLTHVSQPHVIMSQGLSDDSQPVLVTVQCARHDAFPNRQFAYVFQTRTVTNIIATVSVPSQFHHLPFVVQLRGLTYLPGEVVLLQPGNHLLVLVATPDVDPSTEQVVDGFSLLQTAASLKVGQLNGPNQDHLKYCKPAPFDEDTDLPMTFAGPGINRPRRPSHDGNIDWMEDLVREIRSHGVYDPWHAVTNLQVMTWFVNHVHYPVCQQPRITHFTGEVITWIDDLRTTWMDLLDQTATFSVHVIHPRPPGSAEQGGMLHLLLEQSKPVHSAAILVTARFSGFTDEGILQGAYSTPDRLELQMLTNIIGITPHCHERLCHVNVNHLLLPAGVFFDVATGHSVRIRVEPLDTSAHQAMQMPVQPALPLHALHDETNLMQLSTGLIWQPRRGHQLSRTSVAPTRIPCTPVSIPNTCGIEEPSDFVQALQPIWRDFAFSWEGEVHSAQVVTWFLDQRNHHHACHEPRTATLLDNAGRWEEQLKLLWADHIQDCCDIEFHVVTPAPPALEPGVVAHVLIVQAPSDDWISILISYVAQGSDQRPLRMALTTHEFLSLEGVLQSVETCCQVDRMICSLWHAQHQFTGHQYYQGRSGYSLVIHTSQPAGRRNVVKFCWSYQHDPSPKQCSFTEEFLRTVRAVQNAPEPEGPPPQVTNIDAGQSFVLNELWDLAQAQSTQPVGNPEPAIRVETWFLDHNFRDRCYNSRVVLLSLVNFHDWSRLIIHEWRDHVRVAANIEFSLVYPAPETIDPAAVAQVILTQSPQSELRSIVMSIYDSERAQQPPYTFAMTHGSRLTLGSILEDVRLTRTCPPHKPQNECTIWLGGTAIPPSSQVFVRSGNAFKLRINRGMCLDLQSLLRLPDHLLRQQLQQAIWGEIFHRPGSPPEVAGSSGVAASSTGSPYMAFTPQAAVPIEVDHRPPWLTALNHLYVQFAATEVQEEGPVLYVQTWYVHGDGHLWCREPRPVRLTSSILSWRQDLVQVWSHRLIPHEPQEYWVVPVAPNVANQNVDVHVVLSQGLMHNQAAVFFTVCPGPDPASCPVHAVYVLPSRITVNDIVQLLVPHAFRSFPCTVHLRGVAYGIGEVLTLLSGDQVQIRYDTYAGEAEDDSADELGLLQTRAERAVTPLHQNTSPHASPIYEADDNIVELHTWFVHAFQQSVCYHPITVCCSFPFDAAEVCKSVWSDKVGDCSLQYCTFASQSCNERHVIGWPLETPADVVAVLIEAKITGDHEPLIAARAALVPARSTAANLGLAFGIDLASATEKQQQCCQFRYKGFLYNWQDPLVLESGTTVAIEWDSGTIASLPLSIDFTIVYEVHEWLDTHFVLPSFDLPSQFPWLPSSRQWTMGPWWEPRFTAFELRIYYDGSSFKQADSTVVGGAAVAAFVSTADGWMFAGAVSTSLKQGTSAYLAELDAAIIAHKFAHDLLKTCAVSQGFLPIVEFWFDSETVGNQAAGRWQICSHPRTGQFVRCLHRWIEARFKTELRHRHVKAHNGEPGNELVDVLAFQAAMGSPTQDWQDWLAHATTASFVEAAEWLWFLYRTDVSWDGTKALLPAGPATRPASNVFPTGDQQKLPTTQPESGHLNLICATCNVLSLKPSSKASALGGDAVAAGPARQDSLLQQFHEAGIHLFAWQETRLKRPSNQHDSRYWLFCSPANSQGHYGIIIGLNRLIPLGKITSDGVEADSFISENHIDIIAAEPRFLVLRITRPLLRCIVIGGHAPHTGADDNTIHNWWNTLGASIPHKYDAWDRLLLVDANARVGAEPSRHIGDHQAEPQDHKADPFVAFVASQGLWLPATFAAYHTGLGATWRHSRGHWFRNDFIGIPLAWPLSHCSSWVSSDIDVGLAKEDHRTVMLHLQRQVAPFQSGQRPQKLKLKIDLASSAPLSDLASLAIPGWHMDVHSHASVLQSNIVEHVWPWRAKTASKPRRTTMTATTWELVKEKREVRNLLHERSNTQRQTLLTAWFAAWKHASRECTAPDLFRAFDSLLTTQDRLIAVALSHFRVLGTRVVKSLKQDDIAFYQDLLTDCTAFLHPAEAKNLWKVVRRSLPKFQQRRSMFGPARMAELEDQWLPHFSDLEAGVTTNATALVDHCHFMQSVRRLDSSLEVQLGDLPSLFQLEQAFRAISEGKATGYDPLPSEFFHKAAAPLAFLYHDLFLKEYLWQSEPIQNKGGPMAIIPKQLQPTLAKQFRGILLLPNAGKRLHAILRGQIMEKLEHHRAPGQLGGFPGQQVLFGSQAIRTFGTICDQQGISSAILFLDLSSAFHHLVREAVVGSCDGCNLAPVMNILLGSRHPIDKFQHFARLPGILAELGLPDAIVRLLQDIHICTWCTIHDRWLLHTHRGTRPGSPLADIVFHALMARIAQAMDEWLSQCSDYQKLLHSLEIEVPTILWADDIAIPLATRSADALVPFLQLALAKAHDLLSDTGFLLNFSKGKTSAVITFRGKGSSELRKTFQLCPVPGVQCQFSNEPTAWLHFVASYKHLGTMFASNHDLMCELRVRVGIAKAAFAQLSKPILTNKNLPVHIRLQMFHCLIATKLFFGLGAWTTPAPKQLQYLQSALVGFLRRVLRLGRMPCSAEQILARANVGDVRARLAVDRLLYAQRLFRTGPPFLHCLLHREFDCSDLSWLHGLRADLVWFNDVLPGQLPGKGVTDLTEIILMWQNPRSHWNAVVRRAWKIHLRQNNIIADAKQLHGDVFRNLRAAGATFTSVAQDWEDLGVGFDCFCGKRFETQRGLLAHQRKTHAMFSLERKFLQGCTCLHCGKFLWSTQRLQQHLSYIPKGLGYNPCYFALSEQNRCVEYERVDLGITTRVAGLNRREALQTLGPSVWQDPVWQQQHHKISEELQQCFARVEIVHHPDNPSEASEFLGNQLSFVTLDWFYRFYPQGPDDHEKQFLADAWVQTLCDFTFGGKCWNGPGPVG